MSYLIDLQHACEEDTIPVSDESLIAWATLPLKQQTDSAELTVRLVPVAEIISLNTLYRNQPKATNVLAFPAEVPPGIELEYPLLGDVVICPEILLQESIEQQKALEHHWAHIVIHGVLHLLGFDHIDDNDAKIMQAEEVNLLAQLGFANPYHEEDYQIE